MELANTEYTYKFQGSKYERGLSTTEIAKRFRADVAAAKKAGELPKALKLSVRTQYFSGGSSIDIVIKECGFNPLNPARVQYEQENPNIYIETLPSNHPAIPGFSDEGRNLLKRLEDMINAYNFDDSETMTDYFHVNFYEDVNFDWGKEKQWKEEILNGVGQ